MEEVKARFFSPDVPVGEKLELVSCGALPCDECTFAEAKELDKAQPPSQKKYLAWRLLCRCEDASFLRVHLNDDGLSPLQVRDFYFGALFQRFCRPEYL